MLVLNPDQEVRFIRQKTAYEGFDLGSLSTLYMTQDGICYF